MMESRSAYGWYGEAGGVTGESKPVKIERERLFPRDIKERVKVIRAMETLSYCLNNEDYFWYGWRANGVADGDITYETTDEEIADNYADDETFRDCMAEFLYDMYKAYKDGGLYCDEICTE